MSEISWIKLKTKMFDDEKIQLIEALPEADAILIIWVKLLILAGKTNSNGFILLAENIPYSTEMLSTIFRRPLQIVKFALKTLKDFGMIEILENNVISISNWEKHQNIEGLDKVREQNRLRQQKFRDQKLLKQGNNQESLTLDNVTVTQQNKNKINKNKDKEIFIEEFNMFWDLYDKKVGKPNTYKEWLKINTEEKKKIFEILPIYIKSKPDKKFRKDPERFLKYKVFNDEIIEDNNGTTNQINRGNNSGKPESIGTSGSDYDASKSKYKIITGNNS